MPELQRAKFHGVAETGSWSGTEETLQAMRRTSFRESDSLRPDNLARGGIPDCSDYHFVGIRCRRGRRRRHIYLVGRRALSALSRSTCRSVKASE